MKDFSRILIYKGKDYYVCAKLLRESYSMLNKRGFYLMSLNNFKVRETISKSFEAKCQREKEILSFSQNQSFLRKIRILVNKKEFSPKYSPRKKSQ